MKKKSLLKLFGITLAACAVSGALVGVDQALTANAAAPVDAVFEMEQKASVRFGESAEDAGIRFRVKMDEAMKNYIVENDGVSYGFLIFQQKDLGTITDDYHTAIAKKVEIAGDENKIYKDGGSYWANGALTKIDVAANFDRELTCVAYTYDGTDYEYADLLDVEFSRSVYEVSSAAYIGEPNNREKLTETYTALGDSAPVLIGSYDDLAALSTEVTDKGTTFANVKFELGANIELADGYAAIPQAFAGTIDFGNYSVIAAKGETISENASIVSNAKYVEVVDNTPYLMIVDSTNRTNYKAGTSSMAYTSATDLAALTNVTGEYSGNAANVNGANDLKGTVALGWTGAQLQALKQSGYNSVTFTFLAKNASTAGKLYTAVKNFEVVGQMGLWRANQWYSVAVNIDDVAAAMADNTLTLFDGITRTGQLTTFYFGDIALSKETASEMTTLWDASESYGQLKDVSAWTESSGKIATVTINNGGQYDETLGGYVTYNGNKVNGVQAKNGIFLQLDYTVEQLTSLKEKYTGITTTLYISAATTNTSGSLTFNSDLFGTQYFIGVGKAEEGKTAYNTSVTLTATIDDLITAMNKFDQTLGADKTLNYLYLGTIEDRAGAAPSNIYFTDFVLTKAE